MNLIFLDDGSTRDPRYPIDMQTIGQSTLMFDISTEHLPKDRQALPTAETTDL